MTELPPHLAKKLPKYPLIATFLGKLAGSREHQGPKFGRLLLMDALHRSWQNTAQIASIGVVAEAARTESRQRKLTGRELKKPLSVTRCEFSPSL